MLATWYVARPNAPSPTETKQAIEPVERREEFSDPAEHPTPKEQSKPSGRVELRVGRNQRYATPQMAIDAAPNGSHIIILAGEYYSDTPIAILGKSDLTITGEGAVSLLLGDKDANVIEVEKSVNVRFENLKVKHTNPPPGDRCSGYVFSALDSTNLSIVDSDINGSGLMGLVAGNVNGILLENNFFHENREEGIYIYSGIGTVKMFNNRFEDNGSHMSYNFEKVSENRNDRGLEMSGNAFLSTRPPIDDEQPR